MALEHAGKSIVEMLWDQLDIQYARLMELRDAGATWTEEEIKEELETATVADAASNAAQIVAHLELKGKVAGLAYALAKLRNPAKPNLDAIRKEVAARYVPPTDDEEDENDG